MPLQQKNLKPKLLRITAILLAMLLMLSSAVLLILRLHPDLDLILIQTTVKRKAVSFEKADLPLQEYSLTQLCQAKNCIFNQALMLINEEFLLPEDFSPEVTEYKNTGVIMNSCAIPAYTRLSADILQKYKKKLLIKSSFRTEEEQKDTEGIEGFVAQPGASEHQAGLALDVYVPYFAGSAFPKTDAGRFINLESWRYGFIMRYPFDKTDITHIGYEPWHIRYTGQPHAEIIYKNSLTLEEYILQMEENVLYASCGYWITRQRGDRFQLPENFQSVTVSPDNTGCFIFTMLPAG